MSPSNYVTLACIFAASFSQGSAIANTDCNISVPPKDAGETQAHGVILYIYPRSHLITSGYNGCQNQWFLDDDHYRKLNVVHYKNGEITQYDNIRINGSIGYQCIYENKLASKESDKRCPDFEKLKKQTYQAGCYSKSKLNWSDSYDVAFDYCQFQ